MNHVGRLALDPAEVLSLLSAVGDLAFELGPEGEFLGFAGARSLLDAPHEALLGRRLVETLPPEAAAAAARALAEVSRRRAAASFEYSVPAPQGPRHFEARVAPAGDGRAFVIVRDVQTRWQAEERRRESEARFRVMADHAPVLLWMAGTDGECDFFNHAWLEFTGRAMEQEVGVGWASGVHPEDFQRCMDSYLAAFVERRAFRMEYRLRRADGAYRWILDQGTPRYAPDGAFEGYIGSCVDITDSKESAAEVLRLNAELEARVQQRTAQLAEAVRVAREANAALQRTQSALVQREKLAGLGQMVAGVAHEINNPLAFVTNNLAVVRRDCRALTDVVTAYREGEAALEAARPDLVARVREIDEEADLAHVVGVLPDLIARTHEGLRRIQQIVKDLRDFARLDEGEVHEADLNEGVVATVNIIAGAAREREVRVELDLGELAPVTCYPAKINQVVMNLLSNAVDASPEGSTVVVRTRPEGDGARIEVIDRGAGIDPAIQGRIFDPFFTTKPPGAGTGLGLSISYGIVQDHGGAIEVDSAPGRGARFAVTLPRRPPPRARASERPRASDAEG